MYLRTVRGDTMTPSFSFSSLAIRSSPQVGLPLFISMINRRRLACSGGRPRRRDFQRHQVRNAARCHRTKVSGLTMASAERQSKHRASITIVSRIAVVVRRRLVLRSRNNASCFRRKRFQPSTPRAKAPTTESELATRDSTSKSSCSGDRRPASGKSSVVRRCSAVVHPRACNSGLAVAPAGSG